MAYCDCLLTHHTEGRGQGVASLIVDSSAFLLFKAGKNHYGNKESSLVFDGNFVKSELIE
jgi:hypothetical protein